MKQPTCSEFGYKERSCSCGDKETEDILERLVSKNSGDDNTKRFSFSESHLGKNIIIEGADVSSLYGYIKEFETALGRKIRIMSKNMRSADLAGALANFEEDDGCNYLIIDATALIGNDEICDIIRNSILEKRFCITMGKGSAARKLDIEIIDVHFIIFTEALSLLDLKLVDTMDVIL